MSNFSGWYLSSILVIQRHRNVENKTYTTTTHRGEDTTTFYTTSTQGRIIQFHFNYCEFSLFSKLWYMKQESSTKLRADFLQTLLYNICIRVETSRTSVCKYLLLLTYTIASYVRRSVT